MQYCQDLFAPAAMGLHAVTYVMQEPAKLLWIPCFLNGKATEFKAHNARRRTHREPSKQTHGLSASEAYPSGWATPQLRGNHTQPWSCESCWQQHTNSISQPPAEALLALKALQQQQLLQPTRAVWLP